MATDAKLAGGKVGVVLRWFFSAIWLIYLIQPVADLFELKHPHSPLYQAVAVALVVAFCVLYVFLIGTWWENRARGRVGLVVLAGLAVAICLTYGAEWTPIFIYVSSATGFIIWDRRRALLAVAACTVAYVVVSEIVHTKPTDLWAELLPVALIGFAMIGFKMQIVLNQQLRQARGAVAKLAASEERLRLARDMHDLTGQSLSLITLKSELAIKRLARLPASPEVDAVAAELGDIGRVSRQTLQDIREAVSGYRRPTLAVEIITARTSLEAAGIAAGRRPGPDDPVRDVRPGRRGRAGLVPARGRHQRDPALGGPELPDPAHRARDRGAVPGDHRRRPWPARKRPRRRRGRDRGSGSGLHNMSERLSAVDGRFSAGPGRRDGHGFRLVATVPLAPAIAASGNRAHHARRAAAMALAFGRDPRARPPARPGPVRLLLADDQALIRQALAALLSFEPDMEVVAQVGRGDEVVKAAAEHQIDVALLDIEMPGMDGLAAAGQLHQAQPDVKIVILTTFGRPGFLRRAMQSGVSAFIVKDSPPDRLATAVRKALAGERVIDPDLAAAALAEGINPLTPRERDVLAASADGSLISEIAGKLYLSEGTVRNYLSACIQKTGARNRTEALHIAEERGWL